MNGNQKLVSVIIPGYNCSSTIERVLDAVLSSEFEHAFEVIFVNDGSTDDTVQKVNQYQSVRQVSTGSKSGVGVARNVGVEHAKGEILILIDSDVIVQRDTLKRFYQEYHNHDGKSAIYGTYSKGSYRPDSSSKFVGYKLYYLMLDISKGCEAIPFYIFQGMTCIGKSLFRATGGFSPAFRHSGGEEFEFGARLKDKGVGYFYMSIQGDHQYRTVLDYLGLMVRRTYNFAAIVSTMKNGKSIQSEIVSGKEICKLLIVLLGGGGLLAGMVLPVIWAFLPLLLGAYIIVDWGFLNFLRKEESLGFAVKGMVWDWALFVAKGIGVLYFYFSWRLLGFNQGRYY